MKNHKQTILELLNVIERYSYEQLDLRGKLSNEMRLFRQAHDNFGRLVVVADCHILAHGKILFSLFCTLLFYIVQISIYIFFVFILTNSGCVIVVVH